MKNKLYSGVATLRKAATRKIKDSADNQTLRNLKNKICLAVKAQDFAFSQSPLSVPQMFIIGGR